MFARLYSGLGSLMVIAGLLLSACQPVSLPSAPAATVTPEPEPGPASPFVLAEDEFTSDALAGNLLGDPATRKFAIYLPPTYASGEGAYPVVYVLHWYSGNQWTMSEFAEVVDGMIRAGEIPEMIVVMPDASNTYQGSFYMSSPTIGDYETYITQELVAWVDAHYRTLAQPESRGITGCSMGGLGAVRLSLLSPQTYSVVAGVSGPYLQDYHGMLKMALKQISALPDTLAELGQLPNPVQAAFAIAAAGAPNPELPPFYLDMPFAAVDGEIQYVEDVYRRMGDVYIDRLLEGDLLPEAQGLHLLIYQGNADPLAEVEGTRLFAAMLGEQGIPYEYVEVDGGGHCTLDYAPAVQFFADHLVFGQAD